MRLTLLLFFILSIKFPFNWKNKEGKNRSRGCFMKKLNFQNLLSILIDMGLIYYSFLLATFLLNDFKINFDFIALIYDLIWIYPLYLLVFKLFNVYRYIWKYASILEVLMIGLAVTGCYIGFSLVTLIFHLSHQSNLIILSHLILFLLLIGFRYGNRFISYFKGKTKPTNLKRTLIIGAGSCGVLVVKEIKVNRNIDNQIIGFVDDDINKVGKVIQGKKVVGTTNELNRLVDIYKIDVIIISIPSLNKADFQKLLKKCENLKAKVLVFPPFYQLIDKEFSFKQIREVEISDLLDRDEVVINDLEISKFLKDKDILVTGGGGSIGSELCRQIINHHPRSLIIFDQYENNAYDIQNELLMNVKKLKINTNIIVLIGSIQDKVRLTEVFNQYPISIVFHAAAHKHVPLMENSPKEAIKNNVFGTYNLAKISSLNRVEKFILISSDKAVNPTNIMGATKRLAEMIMSAFNGVSITKFSAVRFGNVLGSNGSVIPLFKKQIEAGGPVTVTDKNIIRYFMTISEATSLVLQSASNALGCEIFVLDMGEPVKILKLAEKLISLSGFIPYEDIEIKFTGLRPGEKLYEELLLSDEHLDKTKYSKIYCLRQKYIDLDKIKEYIEELEYLLSTCSDNIEPVIKKMVPTYKKQVLKEGII